MMMPSNDRPLYSLSVSISEVERDTDIRKFSSRYKPNIMKKFLFICSGLYVDSLSWWCISFLDMGKIPKSSPAPFGAGSDHNRFSTGL